MATLSLKTPIIKKQKPFVLPPHKKEYIINGTTQSKVEDANAHFKKNKPGKEAVILTTKQKVKKTLNWLCKNYPKTFNRMKPRPLKRGIQEELITEMELKKTHIKPKLIKKALRYYTSSMHYKKCFTTNNQRIDLSGRIHEEVLPHHKEYAEIALKLIEERCIKPEEKK